MIELVPMAYRVVNDIDASPEAKEAEALALAAAAAKTKGKKGPVVRSDVRTSKMDEDEERDAVFLRLEGLGYRVGQGLVERYALVLFCVCWEWKELIELGIGSRKIDRGSRIRWT